MGGRSRTISQFCISHHNPAPASMGAALISRRVTNSVLQYNIPNNQAAVISSSSTGAQRPSEQYRPLHVSQDDGLTNHNAGSMYGLGARGHGKALMSTTTPSSQQGAAVGFGSDPKYAT